jgi:hypothetical protein
MCVSTNKQLISFQNLQPSISALVCKKLEDFYHSECLRGQQIAGKLRAD